MHKYCVLIVLILSSAAFGQRPFSEASPKSDHDQENKRIEKLGYKTCREYRVSDASIDPKEGTLTRTFEYGNSALLSLETEYSDDDTSRSRYEYDLKGNILGITSEYASGQVNIGYVYGKKGLLEEIIVAAIEARDKFVKHNPDGTIKEIDVRMPQLDINENSEIIEPHKIINFPYQKVAYIYDKNKRPITEITSRTIDSKKYETSFQIKYTYDVAGRVINILHINENDYRMNEEYTYDSDGSLVMLVIVEGKDMKYFKFIYGK